MSKQAMLTVISELHFPDSIEPQMLFNVVVSGRCLVSAAFLRLALARISTINYSEMKAPMYWKQVQEV